MLIWVPCLLVASYNVYRAATPHRPAQASADLPVPPDAPLGKLGRYVIDSTEMFGLFVALENRRVFVDIREDEQLEARKARAAELLENVNSLEASLAKFRTSNPEYMDRTLGYICIHAKDTRRCEVFWDPQGHTLLRGVEFANE
jgi:hypothetical protein